MQQITSNLYLNRYESLLELTNGEEIFLRPIKDSDRHLLIDLFNRMSPDSVHLRFLKHLKALPENMINRLITTDYHSNFALVAIADENGKDAIISVGRYGYDPDDDLTELAVAVRDDWQQIGLGRVILLKIVNIAKYHGITHFTGTMNPQNKAIQKLLTKLGYKVKYSLECGFYKVDITT